MSTYNLITDPIKLNEFRFYRENPTINPLYATRPFDGFSAADTNLPWMLQNTFMHKKLFNDICTVYIQTQANFIGTALPYPDLQLLDVNKNVVTDISILPFIKGAQQVTGNTIYNPNTNTDVQANTYCWQFRFQDLITADQSGVYYLRCVNTASDGESSIAFLTEPIFVFGVDATVTFNNTVLIQCYNNTNNNYMGYIKSGWSDEAFYPIFRHRIEGYLTEFEAKGIYISMLEQEYQPNKINAQNYRSWKFELGGSASHGVPDFMNEKINEVFSTDIFTIDGKRYERDVSDTDAGIKALWQGSKPQSANRRFMNTILREYKNWQYIFFDQVNNPCSCPELTAVRVTKSGPSYFANFSFNLPDGISCPFYIYVATSVTSGTITIDSLSDFSSVVGDVYTKTILIGGFPDITYIITKFGGAHCASGSATFDCDSPSLIGASLVDAGGGDFNIQTQYSDCGDDCHTSVWTYVQVLPASGTPDSGTFTDTVDCPPSASYSHTVTPADYTSGTVKYSLSYTDCCGNTGSADVTFTPPCSSPTLIDVSPYPKLFIPGLIFGTTPGFIFDTDTGSCAGATCKSATVQFTQINSGIIGAPDSGTIVIVDICAVHHFIVTPNTSYPGYSGVSGAGRIKYHIKLTTCCGTVFEQDSL